uniref:Uncharacterized protein n=1 Tax=Anopheles melas TaxID=34690 RepID=A0A182UB28_9DIPT
MDVVIGVRNSSLVNEKLINTYTDVPYDVEILDLSINIISTIENENFMFLHLASCRIPHVFDTMFIDLPNLKSLDLAKNIMNSLSTVPFAHLRKLNSLNLMDNRPQL